jgi:hypothetical protein
MRSESLLQTSSLANSGVISFMLVESSKRASKKKRNKHWHDRPATPSWYVYEHICMYTHTHTHTHTHIYIRPPIRVCLSFSRSHTHTHGHPTHLLSLSLLVCLSHLSTQTNKSRHQQHHYPFFLATSAYPMIWFWYQQYHAIIYSVIQHRQIYSGWPPQDAPRKNLKRV